MMCQSQSIDESKGIEEQAHIAYSQGRYLEAELFYQQVLEMTQRLYPGDHPDVASSLYNLAAIYEVQELYLYQEALEMRERLQFKIHGNNPDESKMYKAKGIEEQAHTAYSQERYQEAKRFYQQVLEVRKELCLCDHPDLASSINNMASIYEVLTHHLYQQALKIRKRLGVKIHSSNPDKAKKDEVKRIEEQAHIAYSQERYQEAKRLYQQASKMRERLLGGE